VVPAWLIRREQSNNEFFCIYFATRVSLTTLPRHNVLAKGYVENAVKLIDQLLNLQEERE
jgi:hypothetical protein